MQWLKNIIHWLGNHIDMWRAAWYDENHQVSRESLKPDELEFLPAILEIQESPASPVGRTIAIVIVLLFVIAVIWSTFGTIDIVATAQGKVVATGRTKVIQPLETSVIKAIHVIEGQLVEKGQVLIELDPTSSGADVARLSNDYTEAKMDYAVNRAIADKLDAPEATLEISAYVSDVPQDTIALHQAMAEQRYIAYNSKILSLKNVIRKSESELRSLKLSLNQTKKSLPLIKMRVVSYKSASSKGIVSYNQYLEIQQQYIEMEKELVVTREKMHESLAAIASAKQERASTMADFSQSIYAEIKKAKQLLVSTKNELIKARQTDKLRVLMAPVAGRVQELAVFTVGGIVTPAQELMKIAPNHQAIEVQALIENKDIGFVNPGQTAEIKLEAFPFTKYGTIEGKVITLSNDAVPVEKMGMLYQARVSMKSSVMRIENKQINITSGMNATVEISTGKRRVIEYFLSPILKGFKESVNER